MTTKGSSRKQIIVSIGSNNIKRVMIIANTYISNINRLFKGVKSKIFVNFIHFDNKRILITINKVVVASDLNIIEKYMKNLNKVDFSDIMSSKLLQFKFYLKILNILYFIKNTNLSIFSDIIESVTKSTHIFNNIVLVLYLHIIKASQKSDMAVIWIDI